jgi:hypothetical protein
MLFAPVILPLCLVSGSSSQIFEVNSDARWIALGQVTDGYDGFNAIQQFLTSSSSKFVEINYASRPINWISSSDLRYWHTSISASLDLIQWARISYQRFDYGEFLVADVTQEYGLDRFYVAPTELQLRWIIRSTNISSLWDDTPLNFDGGTCISKLR